MAPGRTTTVSANGMTSSTGGRPGRVPADRARALRLETRPCRASRRPPQDSSSGSSMSSLIFSSPTCSSPTLLCSRPGLSSAVAPQNYVGVHRSLPYRAPHPAKTKRSPATRKGRVALPPWRRLPARPAGRTRAGRNAYRDCATWHSSRPATGSLNRPVGRVRRGARSGRSAAPIKDEAVNGFINQPGDGRCRAGAHKQRRPYVRDRHRQRAHRDHSRGPRGAARRISRSRGSSPRSPTRCARGAQGFASLGTPTAIASR